MNIHNKINVISQCQEAIKVLTGATKSGRFILKEVTEDTVDISHGSQGLSPLKARKVISFPYTLRRRNAKRITVEICLSKLMTTLGKQCVLKAPKEISSKRNNDVSTCAVVGELSTEKQSAQIQVDATTQTENSTCEECERRKILQTTSDTQTNDIHYFDVGCQVEDIRCQKLQANIVRQHSLASLTPAQLLNCGEELITTRYRNSDCLGAKRKRYSEFPPREVGRRADSVSACDSYNDQSRTVENRDSQISSNRLFHRDRPQFSNTFRPKSVPFSNFDTTLNLTLPRASVYKYK